MCSGVTMKVWSVFWCYYEVMECSGVIMKLWSVLLWRVLLWHVLHGDVITKS